MKRCVFLQVPLVAAPFAIAKATPQTEKQPKTGIKVEKDKDRNNENLELGRVGSRIDAKVSSKDTEGELYIYESRTVGKGGPPLHVHPGQDEWIYVLQGRYLFQVGDEKFDLQAGDSLLAPRNVPHAFSYEGGGLGKMIITFQPAGKMEAFFSEVHENTKQTRRLTEVEEKDLFRRHNMKVVGPRLRGEEAKSKS